MVRGWVQCWPPFRCPSWRTPLQEWMYAFPWTWKKKKHGKWGVWLSYGARLFLSLQDVSEVLALLVAFSLRKKNWRGLMMAVVREKRNIVAQRDRLHHLRGSIVSEMLLNAKRRDLFWPPWCMLGSVCGELVCPMMAKLKQLIEKRASKRWIWWNM